MEPPSPVGNLENMINTLGVVLPINIKRDIAFDLQFNQHANKHYSFIIDLKTKRILCYATNLFFKGEGVFPYSSHAEIESLVKYCKSKAITKNKKILIVMKLSKTGMSGNSRCCLHCMRFIRNVADSINLRTIYYSMPGNELVELACDNLIDSEFRCSKGYEYRKKLRNALV
jgi:hypothetical protein